MENTSYEMMFILAPDLGEQETEKEIEEVRKLITENGGEITNEDLWGIREFTYRMKKFDSGYYVVFNLNMPPEKVSELEKPMNINKNLLRFLMMKTPKNYQLKKLEEYQAQWAKEDEEKEKEKEKKEEKRKAQKRETVRKPAKKKEEVVVEEKPEPKEEKSKKEPKKEEPAEEQKEEPKEKKVMFESEMEEPEVKLDEEKTKESKKKLDEVDEKLKSIINDPDISL